MKTYGAMAYQYKSFIIFFNSLQELPQVAFVTNFNVSGKLNFVDWRSALSIYATAGFAFVSGLTNPAMRWICEQDGNYEIPVSLQIWLSYASEVQNKVNDFFPTFSPTKAYPTTLLLNYVPCTWPAHCEPGSVEWRSWRPFFSAQCL